ncbi:uncharacterized protein LOC115771278 [Drosophila novamexicana]|uniref:uncharacterized protein LOC115771278 n=1 Tax=Drosophila novamexicana TaxID=47314 RepID=UPI0011E5938E|nr:uncharacterized protein LOC115771278 [Drosophila novamexicana]
MKKATEASASDDKAGAAMSFQLLSKSDLRQETVHDFVAYTADGDCISLLGSKTELLTLELNSKSNPQLPFPYVVASWKCANKKRPLDQLSLQVNLQNIYESSNVLEMQQLSLEPAYTAVCSQDVPLPNWLAAKLSTQPLPNGQMLLATLNSYGALHLLRKSPEQPLWRQHEKGLNVTATLRDTLQPPYEVPAVKINTFRQYQAFVDRSWITMFAWRPVDSGSYVLVLGTAAGSIWTLTLCANAATVLDHCELQTLLGRICFMQIYEDLLLVGDHNGLVHLYRFGTATEVAEEGLCLVKTLWLRPDHMGLQEALITHCPERDCYYIACCKAAHLLIWCMPKQEEGDWLETRLHAGGMKITGLCALENCNYALVTARGQLYHIELSHKPGQLCASMRPIGVDDAENYQPVGLCCSPSKNLLTILYTRSKEFLLNKTVTRHMLHVRVGRIHNSQALVQLERRINPSQPINSCRDLLVDMRLEIFQGVQLEEYVNYAPFDMIAFDDLATENQQQQLQLKYHILDALIQMQRHQRNQTLLEQFEQQLQLLLAMLALTHMRLRLQFLTSLQTELTAFQRQSAQCQLAESALIRQQLEQRQLQREQAPHAVIKRFLAQMEVHFEQLQLKLNVPETAQMDDASDQQLCTVSYVQVLPTLERHYCTLCGRLALLDRQLLLELYAPGSVLLCPCCHGSYTLELLDA